MKIGDLTRTTEGRRFINTSLLPRLASQLAEGADVLFVGIDSAWDYKNLFWNPSKLCNFKTMDKNESFEPDIVGDISNCPDVGNDSFDLVILIGVYEFINNKKAMFKEIHRILKPQGKALLSLPGRGYYPDPNNSVEPWEVFKEVLPLFVKECYIIGESCDRRPTSIHLICQK